MGASHFVATHGDDKVFKKNRRTLDLIICTTNDDKMPLSGYLDLLKPGGKLIFVGLPEGGLPKVAPSKYILNGITIGGSAIGVCACPQGAQDRGLTVSLQSPAEIKEMLQLAKDHNIQGWIKKYDMNRVNEAVPSQHKGDARYRYVLVNTEHGAKL